MTELSLKIGNRVFIAQDSADDLCMEDLFEMFKGLLIGHTFQEESFKDMCKKYAEEAQFVRDLYI